MTRRPLRNRVPDPVFQRFREYQTKARAIAQILRPGEYIFYQSHMRAFTTLTSHILASSPEVAGYVELHRSYRHPADLVMMRHQIQALSGAGLGTSRYYLDKLLHNGNGVSSDVGQSEAVNSIFALRRPAETLPSIVAMVAKTGEAMDYATPEGATDYYIRRVERLAHEASKAGRSFYFDAETIVDETDRLLSRLTGFLDLSHPLSSDYETFEQTGKIGIGDPSENIATGTVVRDREKPQIDFPADLVADADTAYVAARRQLLATCSVTVTQQGVVR